MNPNKDKAKLVLLELLRQSKGKLSKAMVSKGFWIAHLYYFKMAAGYLTDWPIVKMPNGPGIDQADLLIQELKDSGNLTVSHEAKGPFTEIVCRLTDKEVGEKLPEGALAATNEAAQFLKTHSSASISQLSHEFSRSWRNKDNGAELDIYTDLIPDDVYQARWAELNRLKKEYEDLFE